MPPANSPVAESPDLQPTRRNLSPLIPALSRLGSPVLDLASTLAIQASDVVDADNVSFLRSPLDPTEDERPERLQHQLQAERRRNEILQRQRERNLNEEARERRRHEEQIAHIRQTQEIGETLDRIDRSQGAASDALGRASRIAYGDRIPNSQSLYDWAPAAEEGEEEELEDILHELRQQQPNSNSDLLTDRERGSHTENETRYRYHSSRFLPPGQAPPGHEPSLRSAAILQSVRRNYRFSARSRDLMQRWAVERERAANEPNEQAEEGDRPISSRWLRERANLNESSRYELHRLQWQAQQRPSSNSHRELDGYRRRYLENPSGKQSNFEKAIKSLHILCSTLRDEERMLTALDNDFLTKEDLRSFIENFALNPNPIWPPPETSWLAPGVSYCGYQHAHHTCPPASSSTTLYRLANNQTISSTTIDRSSPPTSNVDATQPWLGPTFTSSPAPQTHDILANIPGSVFALLSYDHWSVRVSIHAADYDNMTLSGTMDAYNVRQVSRSNQDSGNDNQQQGSEIANYFSSLPASSTFLEGEIIDFNHHSLLTESYESRPHLDAAYWSKVEPFKNLKDEELGRYILNRKWIEEEVIGKYVLMRWKEKCFIKPTRPFVLNSVNGEDEGWVNQESPSAELSINGFYYVSLRRKDGHCEGLYCDPKLNTPYQHLELLPEVQGRLGVGSWGFR